MGVPMRGYYVRYWFKGETPSPRYAYQRFFRALYGYTQVVKKANGKTYVYYREGVLTRYPYVKEGKNSVVVPSNALEPLVEFFNTGKNPAHDFTYLDDWNVVYQLEQVGVSENEAFRAVVEAVYRILVRTEEGYVPFKALLDSPHPTVQDLYYIKEYGSGIVESEWFKEVYERDELLKRLYEYYVIAERSL